MGLYTVENGLNKYIPRLRVLFSERVLFRVLFSELKMLRHPMLGLNASLPVHPAHEAVTMYIRSRSVQHKIQSTRGQEKLQVQSARCRAGEAMLWGCL